MKRCTEVCYHSSSEIESILGFQKVQTSLLLEIPILGLVFLKTRNVHIFKNIGVT